MQPTTDPIPGLIRKIAIPAGIGMLFNTLFNVVDTWFAGMISTEALAALAVSFPVYFLVIALMFGIGSGAAALIANALGEGAPDRARRLFGQACLLAVIAGIIVALYGLFLSDPLFRLVGVRGEALSLARTYLHPILLASSFFLLIGACNGFLSAQGDTKSYRNALVLGSLANIGLNPLLIFGFGPLPGFGLLGIALSTILIQALQCVYLWRRTREVARDTCCGRRDLAFDRPVMLDLLRQAVPVSGQMLSTGIGLFAITYFMGRHGEAAIAAYGIALRIEQLAMLPLIGLNTAALTLVGQNVGAGLPARVRQAAWTALGYGLIGMILGAVLIWPLRGLLMGVFTNDGDVIRLGGAYLAVAVLNFKAYALLMISAGILQGMKRPVFAMLVGLFRHVFGPLVVLWLLDPVLELGLPGISWGIFAVAWIGALTSVLFVRYRLSKMSENDRIDGAMPAVQT